MRIVTIRPPWADLIVRGGKSVENRSRNIAGAYRGPVAIHSGLTVAKLTPAQEAMIYANAIDPARENFDAWMGGEDIVGGAIIGVVDLVDVHHADWCWDGHGVQCSPWAESEGHHLVLANPRPLAEPISFRGGQGLRQLGAETTARVWAALL